MFGLKVETSGIVRRTAIDRKFGGEWVGTLKKPYSSIKEFSRMDLRRPYYSDSQQYEEFGTYYRRS